MNEQTKKQEESFRELLNDQYIELGKLTGRRELLDELQKQGKISSDDYLSSMCDIEKSQRNSLKPSIELTEKVVL